MPRLRRCGRPCTIHPRLPLFDVASMDDAVDQSVARPRFTTTLLLVFAIVGVLLGASGIYWCAGVYRRDAHL